jgi:peroxiredoxin
VLVFYRGHWCRYCITQLTELRSLLDPELKKDTELIVVSIDGANETRRTISNIAKDGVEPDFTFLSDPDHAVIDRYGILNPDGSRRGIPHPATYVIDNRAPYTGGTSRPTTRSGRRTRQSWRR